MKSMEKKGEKAGIIFDFKKKPNDQELLAVFTLTSNKWLIRESSELGQITLTYLCKNKENQNVIHNIRLALTLENKIYAWRTQTRKKENTQEGPTKENTQKGPTTLQFNEVPNLIIIDENLVLPEGAMDKLLLLATRLTGYNGEALLQPTPLQSSNLKLFKEFSASPEELNHYTAVPDQEDSSDEDPSKDSKTNDNKSPRKW